MTKRGESAPAIALSARLRGERGEFRTAARLFGGRRVRVPSASVALLIVAWPHTARAAPPAELWAKWQARDDQSSAMIDHSAWNRFLHSYVQIGTDGIARIPYARVAASDRGALSADLARLSSLPISRYSRREQFAFWVDLYNALTVQVVLDHYPVSSIRDLSISPGLFSFGPWGKKLIAVEGEALSLDDIEHRILRPIWRDPRIHYAVNCAALGCPPRPTPRGCSTRRRAITSTTRAGPRSPKASSPSPRSTSGTRPISAAPNAPSSSI